MTLADLDLGSFRPLLETEFHATALDGTSRTLRLVEVEEHPHHPRMAPGFSLVFLEDSREVVDQQLHAFAHDTLGTFDLFLVPIGQNERGTSYEAVVTRPDG